MAMNKAWLVARREFVDHLTTTTFWIGILTVPLVLGLSVGFSVFLKKMQPPRTYALVDRSQWLAAAVEERIFREDLPHLLEGLATDNAGISETKDFPPELMPLVTRLKSMPRSAVDALAGGGHGEGVWQNIDLNAFEPTLKSWWQTLNWQEASRISSRLSANRFKRVSVSPAQQNQLDAMVADGTLFAYVLIPPDPLDATLEFRLVSGAGTNSGFPEWIEGHLDRALWGERLRLMGMADRQIQASVEPFQFSRAATLPGANGGSNGKPWGPLIFAYLLWISVYKISKMLLTVTIEEKSNRMIEILLSSVSPLELMVGKVFGIAGAGLTMVALWSGFSLVSLQVFQSFTGGGENWLSFADQPVFLLSFMVYFLLGYLLYAALLAGLGSVCDNVKEAQTLSMSVNALLFLPLFVLGSVAQNPHGQTAQVLSFFPPFTPFVMMARSTGPPAVWEYLVSGMGLILAIALAFWAAAKVFQIGILRTGKPPKLIEIISWLKNRNRKQGAQGEGEIP